MLLICLYMFKFFEFDLAKLFLRGWNNAKILGLDDIFKFFYFAKDFIMNFILLYYFSISHCSSYTYLPFHYLLVNITIIRYSQ